MEGYTDVVVSHQYGVSNVVSPLGTAMTEQHVTTLRRFADRIVLLFDADTAGDLAVDRAVGLFLTQPVEIAIASMPADVDPDEYLLEHGAEGFEQMLAGATDALSYKWKQLARRFNESGNNLTGQQKAVEEYLKTLADARGSGPVDSMRWGQALSRVSRLTEIPREELNRRFGRPKNTPPPGHSGQGGQRGPAIAPSGPRRRRRAREGFCRHRTAPNGGSWAYYYWSRVAGRRCSGRSTSRISPTPPGGGWPKSTGSINGMRESRYLTSSSGYSVTAPEPVIVPRPTGRPPLPRRS